MKNVLFPIPYDFSEREYRRGKPDGQVRESVLLVDYGFLFTRK